MAYRPSWSTACDYFSALEALYKMINWPVLDAQRNGNNQGDAVRILLVATPEHAKRLHKALGDNIQRFEQANGKINVKEQPQIPLNFGPTGEA